MPTEKPHGGRALGRAVLNGGSDTAVPSPLFLPLAWNLGCREAEGERSLTVHPGRSSGDGRLLPEGQGRSPYRWAGLAPARAQGLGSPFPEPLSLNINSR